MKNELKQIRLLTPEVSNQIAAGEVVERPASVLKELVENSLDAGASQIDVALENGGQTLVSVRDDGCGIDSAQLELALKRHATSKIFSVNDLESISSYGFRGEALPSIASVSHFKITSTSRDEQQSGKMPAGVGASLEIDHGKLITRKPAPLPCGTLVEVRDLFSRLPARLKFLKNPATEQKRSQHWLARLALAHPGIGFTLAAGGRKMLNFAKNQDLRRRLGQIWSVDLADEMLPFDGEFHGIRIYGLAAPPHLRLPRADRMYFYVNGRAVNDKRMLAAVRDAYKGRLISKDYPQIVLFLEIEPALVDVNAHPAKTEVRFRDESVIFSAIFGALGKCFQSAAVMGETPETFFANTVKSAFEPKDRIMPLPSRKAPETEEWHAVNLQDNSSGWSQTAPRPFPNISANARRDFSKNPYGLAETASEYGKAGLSGKTETLVENFTSASPQTARFVYFGQILDTYLVMKDFKGNLVLLDQHAAHERIIYERLSSEKTKSTSQLLLIPLEMALTREGEEIIASVRESLIDFGFDFIVEGNALIVKSIPEFFSRSDSRTFLEEMLRERKNNSEELFITAACRAAIKAGQKLSLDEAMELLRQWQDSPRAEFCPHGRPCVLRWDAQALEKLFKRRV